MSRADFHETWRRACERAGHPDAWVHDFRRSAVRAMRRAGIAPHDAMALVGHRTLAILTRYNVTTPEDLGEAVAKRGALDERESAEG